MRKPCEDPPHDRAAGPRTGARCAWRGARRGDGGRRIRPLRGARRRPVLRSRRPDAARPGRARPHRPRGYRPGRPQGGPRPRRGRPGDRVAGQRRRRHGRLPVDLPQRGAPDSHHAARATASRPAPARPARRRGARPLRAAADPAEAGAQAADRRDLGADQGLDAAPHRPHRSRRAAAALPAGCDRSCARGGGARGRAGPPRGIAGLRGRAGDRLGAGDRGARGGQGLGPPRRERRCRARRAVGGVERVPGLADEPAPRGRGGGRGDRRDGLDARRPARRRARARADAHAAGRPAAAGGVAAGAGGRAGDRRPADGARPARCGPGGRRALRPARPLRGRGRAAAAAAPPAGPLRSRGGRHRAPALAARDARVRAPRGRRSGCWPSWSWGCSCAAAV